MMSTDAGVIIVAGGKGVRAGSEEPKQYREIAGVRMLLRAIRPFASHPRVAQIVVVLPEADAANPPAWLQSHLTGKLSVVAGGAERQHSVANGLAKLRPELGIVLVHDAARPFVDAGTIDRVIQVASLGAGAVPGVRLADTVKETDTAGLVVRTVPRDRLVAVQTPQAFPRQMLETAHHRARNDESGVATDDAALCERMGHPVRVVAGNPRNIKVTTAEDFELAESLA